MIEALRHGLSGTGEGPDPASATPQKHQGTTARLWLVLVLCALASLIIAMPNLADPMIRHDDFPALFGDADMYWNKTLHEGRWINWLWTLRGFVTPSWVNFAVYQTLWAVFAGCLAYAAMGRQTTVFWALGLAFLILVAPPARVISLWFNTSTPGLVFVAVFALLALVLSERQTRLLLLPFTVISFMGYTTYPVWLLAICLVTTSQRSLRDLVGLLAWFTFSFAVAVFTVYSINYQVHGVFGVPLDTWRNATPASGLTGLIDNLPLLWETGALLMERIGFSHPVLLAPSSLFFMGVFVASTVVLARHAPLEALYLHAGLWTGMGLMVVQCLKLGLVVPPRAFIFAWLFFALILMRAAQRHSESGGRWLRNCVLIVLGAQAVSNADFYGDFRDWQRDTRQIAAALVPGDSPILVTGNIRDVPSAKRATLHHELAFSFRMEMLVGREVIFCDSDARACSDWKANSKAGTLNHLVISGTGEDVTARLATSGQAD